MSEFGGEIEYLDEDEEIVQRCLQIASLNILQSQKTKKVTKPPVNPTKQLKRKAQWPVPTYVHSSGRKKPVYDSDGPAYDPREDYMKQKKRFKPQPSTKNASKLTSEVKDSLAKRRATDIKIPDFEDPLCLPVKLVKHDQTDVAKLKNWNKLCLIQMNKSDECLRTKEGDVVNSKRTVVLRNVRHPKTGKVELTVWSKTSVENKEGDKKSEVLQCVLPRYREKTVLNYHIINCKRPKPVKIVNEVILQREEQNDKEVLVAYRPFDALAATYKLVEDAENPLSDGDEDRKESPAMKRHLQEVSVCKVCAPCYQASWRPTRNISGHKEISCAVCRRSYMSVYNFLSHIRTHPTARVKPHRKRIAELLSKLVEYHYSCRICQQTFPSIGDMRRHLTEHTSREEMFLCEVGNHVTN